MSVAEDAIATQTLSSVDVASKIYTLSTKSGAPDVAITLYWIDSFGPRQARPVSAVDEMVRIFPLEVELANGL